MRSAAATSIWHVMTGEISIPGCRTARSGCRLPAQPDCAVPSSASGLATDLMADRDEPVPRFTPAMRRRHLVRLPLGAGALLTASRSGAQGVARRRQCILVLGAGIAGLAAA
jgi:hypothetical protein